MIIKNALMTAEEMIWVNFLYETLLRTCSGSTVELQAVMGRQ